MNTDAAWIFLSTRGADLGLKVLGAVVVWFVGRWLIGLARRLFETAIHRGKRVDETLARYLSAVVGFVLNVLLILAILDVFGVRTTSFAALLAGAGLAIGTAWGGLLQHFAAGVFLQVLRPYKVGDHVLIGGINGKVTELGLFGTTVVTADNVQALIGNNKVLADTIQNFSSLPTRRIDISCTVPATVEVNDAIGRLRIAVGKIPNVAREPQPQVEILRMTARGVQLAVRPSAHNDHYWQVYHDTQKAMMDTLGVNCAAPPDGPTQQLAGPATGPV
ncbi:MAG: mechanosensitive ion channel family protein [Haliea sp.]|nr:MAG: mechanosensitive ion channel family protein [Haliea sp.]